MSAKNKIIILSVLWLAATAAMFLYFFKILDNSSQQLLDSMASDQKALSVLQSADTSYKQAQSDIKKLADLSVQPEQFFSKDITLVREIQTLEDLSQKYNVKMTLTGVSGTVNSAAAANTASPMVVIPYGISLSGKLEDVVNFTENLEHVSFVSPISNIAITSADQNTVNAGLTASFYLLK